jgi:hypothetical protein
MTWVAEARRLLDEGRSPVEVLVHLVEGNDLDNLNPPAIAVCAAIGISREEAEKRLGQSWRLDDEELPRGEQAREYGEFLEKWGGLFDVHVEYHGEQRRIANLIAQAFGAIPGGMMPLFFNSYQRAFKTGRLRDALVHLSQPENGVRAELLTAAYWQPLVDAVELLGLDDEAARRCRHRLAVARMRD